MPKVTKAYIKAFKKLETEEDSGNLIQENIASVVEPLLRSPIVNGVLLKGVTLVTGTINQISHTLGRAPQGWIVVRQDANANIWQVNPKQLSSTLLQIQVSANVTVDLWVF